MGKSAENHEINYIQKLFFKWFEWLFCKAEQHSMYRYKKNKYLDFSFFFFFDTNQFQLCQTE